LHRAAHFFFRLRPRQACTQRASLGHGRRLRRVGQCFRRLRPRLGCTPGGPSPGAFPGPGRRLHRAAHFFFRLRPRQACTQRASLGHGRRLRRVGQYFRRLRPRLPNVHTPGPAPGKVDDCSVRGSTVAAFADAWRCGTGSCTSGVHAAGQPRARATITLGGAVLSLTLPGPGVVDTQCAHPGPGGLGKVDDCSVWGSTVAAFADAWRKRRRAHLACTQRARLGRGRRLHCVRHYIL